MLKVYLVFSFFPLKDPTALRPNYKILNLIPWWRQRSRWEVLEHLNLSLEVRVGQGGHHHHVLRQRSTPSLQSRSRWGLETARLLKPPVPHLDLVHLVIGVGQLGHEPGVLHDGRNGVGTELLDVRVRKASLVWGRGLDQISLPVSSGHRGVLGLAFRPHGLQLRVTFEAGVVAERFQFLLWVFLHKLSHICNCSNIKFSWARNWEKILIIIKLLERVAETLKEFAVRSIDVRCPTMLLSSVETSDWDNITVAWPQTDQQRSPGQPWPSHFQHSRLSPAERKKPVKLKPRTDKSQPFSHKNPLRSAGDLAWRKVS